MLFLRRFLKQTNQKNGINTDTALPYAGYWHVFGNRKAWQKICRKFLGTIWMKLSGLFHHCLDMSWISNTCLWFLGQVLLGWQSVDLFLCWLQAPLPEVTAASAKTEQMVFCSSTCIVCSPVSYYEIKLLVSVNALCWEIQLQLEEGKEPQVKYRGQHRAVTSVLTPVVNRQSHRGLDVEWALQSALTLLYLCHW